MTNNTHLKTILILAANPKNTERLRLDREVRHIEDALQRSQKREEFKLIPKLAVDRRNFYLALLESNPHIVHFCGHGALDDGIILENEITGGGEYVNAKYLAGIFDLVKNRDVKCVVLNACYSQLQAQAISQHIDYVIGINNTVEDEAAIAFSVAFYDGLGSGEGFDFAYRLGCLQIDEEDQIPTLLKKELIDSIDNKQTSSEIQVVPPNPYQGLSAFREEDAAFFFGREMFVNDLIEAVNKQPLVAVIGPSGSGKSSVVYAGLIPHLRMTGNWLIESFRPGNQPFYQLASALVRQLTPEVDQIRQLQSASGLDKDIQQGLVTLQQITSRIIERNSGKRLLLFVDQFEELYTLCKKEEQERFIDTLLKIIDPNNITLVFCLRADFCGFVLSYRPLSDALQQFSRLLLSSMSQEELQAAIEKPAQKLEVQLEEDLTQTILDDVGNEPGNLPLLEFALTRLWDKQQNRLLTRKAYHDIEGVKKALANHAEQVYQQLNQQKKKQKQAQRIFVQLVRPGEGTEDTRRIATRAEVGLENWKLVSYLAGDDARLVVTGRNENSGEDTVEIVHETLIREWKRLQEWMESDRSFRHWQEGIRRKQQEWKNKKNDEGLLLRSIALADAENWLNERPDECLAEQDFIQQSLKLRNKEERRRKLGIIGLVIGLVVVSLLALATFQQQREAEAERLGVAALRDFESGSGEIEALVSAMEAGQEVKEMVFWNSKCLQDCPATSPLLALQSILDQIRQKNQINTYQTDVNNLRFINKVKQIVTVGDDGTIRWWDSQGNKLRELPVDKKESIISIDFSKDEKLLATGTSNGLVKLWDLSDNQPKPFSTTPMRHACLNKKCRVNNVRFIPNQDLLATTGDDGTLSLWKLNGAPFLPAINAHKGTIKSLNPSGDGKLLATAGEDGTAKIWHLSGKQLVELKGHQCKVNSESSVKKKCSVNSVLFHPQLQQIATAGDDDTVRIWDFSGKDLSHFEASQDGVETVRIRPDGQQLATAGKDGTVKLWDFKGNLHAELKGHKGSVVSIRYNDNNTLATGGKDDGTVRFWQVSEKPLTKLKGHQGIVTSVRFSPDGKSLVTASEDDTVRLWNLEGKELKKIQTKQNGVNTVRFSPDGKSLVTGGNNGEIKIWNLPDGELKNEIKNAYTGPIQTINFNQSDHKQLVNPSDNKQFVSAGDMTVRLWDLNGKLLKTFKHLGKVETAKLNRDGKLLATAGENGTASLSDVNGNHPISLPGHKGSVYTVQFSPKEKILATGGDDGTVNLWDYSGKQLQTFKTYQGKITYINFSWNGEILSTAFANHKIRLWNLSGNLVAEFTGHGDISETIISGDFSPDDKLLAAASHYHTAIVWRIRNLDQLLNEGCDWLGDYLATHPEEQKKLYVCPSKRK